MLPHETHSGSGSDEEQGPSSFSSSASPQLHSRHSRRRSQLASEETILPRSQSPSPSSKCLVGGTRDQSEMRSGSGSGEDTGTAEDEDEGAETALGARVGALKEHDRWSVWTATSTLHSGEPDPDSCSQLLQQALPEEEDAALDVMLASSFLALQSAQEALQKTLSDRAQLARFRANENALELLMGKKEVELLMRLEANRQMAEYVEQRTSELQGLLRSSASASFPGAPRRRPSYSSSRGSWNLGAPTGDLAAGSAKGAAAQPTGIGIEGSATGILEAPHDQGVTMGKSAARRLEKMLGRQGGSSERSGDASESPNGSHFRSTTQARPDPGEKKDARSMLASLAAASSLASPSKATAGGQRSPKNEASGSGYSPRRGEHAGFPFMRSSSSVSTVTVASFTTAKSASTMATSEASGEQVEELLDDAGTSDTRGLYAPLSPDPSRSPSLSSPGPSRTPSYFAAAIAPDTGTSSTPSTSSSPSSKSNSPTSALLLNRRQRLHRSHPSAPAVVSTTTTSSTGKSSASTSTIADAWNTADPFTAPQPATSTAALTTSGTTLPTRRQGRPQRRSASVASASASTFSVGPGGSVARADATPVPVPSSSTSLVAVPGDGSGAIGSAGEGGGGGGGPAAAGWGLGSWVNFAGVTPALRRRSGTQQTATQTCTSNARAGATSGGEADGFTAMDA